MANPELNDRSLLLTTSILEWGWKKAILPDSKQSIWLTMVLDEVLKSTQSIIIERTK